jgi:hypothetical protein
MPLSLARSTPSWHARASIVSAFRPWECHLALPPSNNTGCRLLLWTPCDLPEIVRGINSPAHCLPHWQLFITMTPPVLSDTTRVFFRAQNHGTSFHSSPVSSVCTTEIHGLIKLNLLQAIILELKKQSCALFWEKQKKRSTSLYFISFFTSIIGLHNWNTWTN